MLLKNFKAWSAALTEQLRTHALTLAASVGQSTVAYLRTAAVRKDELARAQTQARGITEGLVGVWSAVEPCTTYFVRGNRASRRLHLERGDGKCLHYYFYFLHPECGLLHVRLQSWLPYTVTSCLDGHEWLARQMDAQGLGYERCGNAFRWLENSAATQALADAQLQCAWPALLDGLLQSCHPLRRVLCDPVHQPYYWTLKESEFSTDLLFRSEAALARLYPQLLHYGIQHFGSREILRFLGKRMPAEGCPTRSRALQPWGPKDGALLDLLNDGAWLVNGLRNRDLRSRLFPAPHSAKEDQRLAARASRLLRLLRAHGLLKKIGKTHRHQVTRRGREIIAALQTARNTNLDELLKIAA